MSTRLDIAPPVPAITVLNMAVAIITLSPGLDTVFCDPPLNAKNPNSRMKAPRAAS